MHHFLDGHINPPDKWGPLDHQVASRNKFFADIIRRDKSGEKNKYGDEETNISTPEFLEAIMTRDKQYGSYIGVKYGESFLVREPMRLDDPIEFFGPEYLNGIQ